MDLTFVGGIGAFLVLLAFLLNQTNKLSNSAFQYDLINFLGSLFLFLYAVSTQSLPFIVVNLVWGLFSLKDCIKFLRKQR
jgi:hypothetical protein